MLCFQSDEIELFDTIDEFLERWGDLYDLPPGTDMQTALDVVKIAGTGCLTVIKNQIKMEARSIIRLGSEVYMLDPCYNTLDVASGSGRKLQNVLPGDWVCGVEYHSMRDGKPCYVGSLYCWHSEHTDIDFSTDNMTYDGACGVDSGQLGIYDAAYFEDIENSGEERKNDWYLDICRVTLNQDYQAGSKDDKCYVSSSGYGDGGYAVYVKRNEDGYIVAIRVPFIYGDGESDPEEEEEDCWDVDDYWNPEDNA